MEPEKNKTAGHTGSQTDATSGKFRIWRILLPALIGMAVVVYMFKHEFSHFDWHDIDFSLHTILCILLAWIFMGGRDFGLTWRFRTLTDKDLTWGRALKVNFMCEFTSCITPSAVGGSSLGMIFMHHEGINLGRATTLMLTTLFLDELFFVVACPLVMMFIPYDELFGFNAASFTSGLKWTFWLVYAIIAIWTLILFLGIIVKPEGVRNTLSIIFRWRLLRRWLPSVEALGNNMVETSRTLRTRPIKWWLETFSATALTWTSRFLVVNALFFGFVPHADQLVVFCREFVVWVVLMVSPTPGGSGVSEWLFTEYYGDLLHNNHGLALVIAVFWRIITYYVYLIVGAFLAPSMLNPRKAVTQIVSADNRDISSGSAANPGKKQDNI